VLIRDIMAIHPVWIQEDADMRRAAEIISNSEVSDLMVVDAEKNFIGVLSEGDLVRAVLPNFDEVLEAGGTLADAFDFFVRKGRDLAGYSINPLVIKNSITLKPDDEAAQAATIMVEKQIRRLPVIDDGKLVGTVSRADICRAVIYNT
jgi:CBS domain-containing protein